MIVFKQLSITCKYILFSRGLQAWLYILQLSHLRPLCIFLFQRLVLIATESKEYLVKVTRRCQALNVTGILLKRLTEMPVEFAKACACARSDVIWGTWTDGRRRGGGGRDEAA